MLPLFSWATLLLLFSSVTLFLLSFLSLFSSTCAIATFDDSLPLSDFCYEVCEHPVKSPTPKINTPVVFNNLFITIPSFNKNSFQYFLQTYYTPKNFKMQYFYYKIVTKILHKYF